MLHYLITFEQVNRSLFGKTGSQHLCKERRFTRVPRAQSHRRTLRGSIFLAVAERRDQQSYQNRFYHDKNGANYGLRVPQVAHTTEISTLTHDLMSSFGSCEFAERIG